MDETSDHPSGLSPAVWTLGAADRRPSRDTVVIAGVRLRTSEQLACDQQARRNVCGDDPAADPRTAARLASFLGSRKREMGEALFVAALFQGFIH